MAMVFVIFFFFHCDFRMSSWDYFIATAVLYTLCWLYAQCRTWFEHGVRHKARLTPESEETLKITIDTSMDWTPGQHIFLRFLSSGVHALTAHPFTICSAPQPTQRNQLVFYVKRRGGLTGRLMNLAKKSPSLQIPVLLDGPYGGIPARNSMDFDRNIVIGGGAGAGLALSMIEDFIHYAQFKHGKEMQVVIAIRDPGLRVWYFQALEEIATRQARHEAIPGLAIHLHETYTTQTVAETANSGTKTETETKTESVLSKEYQSSTTDIFGIQVFTGRPDLPALIQHTANQDAVSVGVLVCGPPSMTHDVATAAADVQRRILAKRLGGARELWLHTESFS